jgi:GH15 family glucan-1,4-alpha-glucosidase
LNSATLADPPADRRIGEHGIIGNLNTAALVAVDGTIDFLCWPHLDSATLFAALLDSEKGGEFTLSPRLQGARKIQAYIPETNVLTTRWVAAAGSAEVTDLMPHPDGKGRIQQRLIRRVTATRGRIDFDMRCRPRFDYARVVPEVAATIGGVVFASPGLLSLSLGGCVPIVAGVGEAHAAFALDAGSSVYFVLREADGTQYDRLETEQCLAETISAWRAWAKRSTYKGRWREQVTRSALALKLLVSEQHGSIAAAATFGLPEASGAERNWDYRATWLRDASFTVYAFLRLGYVREAERFRAWGAARVKATAPDAGLRIMYSLDGAEAAEEVELDHLAGYGGARPVRIGNAARSQTQLDVYGELLDSIYLANKYGRAISHEGWQRVHDLVEYVIAHWEAADSGIWEIRDEPRHFLHSRLMCWVALDRGIRLAQKRSLSAPIGRWQAQRDRISADIWSNFRHPDKGHFVQSKGGTTLDASLLMMPLVRFVSATDPVWLDTLNAIRDELTDDGLVTRYRNQDGLKGGEGSFTTCTFWYVECLARAGRLDEAHLLMDRALKLANHLGLYSEELSMVGEPLGNFPQALTHLAMISAAYFLDRRVSAESGGEWQP